MTLIPTPTGMDAWMASVETRLGSPPPPPPPPPAGTSPDDTTATLVVAPATTTRTDSGGHVWKFGAAYGASDWNVMRDGVVAYGSAAGAKLGIKTGVIYVLNSSAQWWKDTGSGWASVGSPF